MDAEDDGEGDDGVFKGKPCEAGSSEFALLATDGREEVGFGIGEVIDVDGPCFGRLADAEVKGVVGIGEGGYVEVFCDGVIEFSVCVRITERKKFHLAIGVGDFRDGGDGLAVITIDVVERNRIECVTKHAGEGDQRNFCIGGYDSAFFSKP